jgi:hypothetical protein
VITGDVALDAWLTVHGWDLAIGWLLFVAAVMFLAGLAQLLKEKP